MAAGEGHDGGSDDEGHFLRAPRRLPFDGAVADPKALDIPGRNLARSLGIVFIELANAIGCATCRPDSTFTGIKPSYGA